MKYFLCSIIVTLSFFCAEAKVVKRYSTNSTGSITLTVDSIDFRIDLIRIYGKLNGTPHTSNRIDTMTLNFGNKSAKWSDIDGIDAARWFQWEDSGEITIEIDFPPIASPSTQKLIISAESPKGNSQWIITHKK